MDALLAAQPNTQMAAALASPVLPVIALFPYFLNCHDEHRNNIVCTALPLAGCALVCVFSLNLLPYCLVPCNVRICVPKSYMDMTQYCMVPPSEGLYIVLIHGTKLGTV